MAGKAQRVLNGAQRCDAKRLSHQAQITIIVRRMSHMGQARTRLGQSSAVKFHFLRRRLWNGIKLQVQPEAITEAMPQPFAFFGGFI
jgi:hypothetical protein